MVNVVGTIPEHVEMPGKLTVGETLAARFGLMAVRQGMQFEVNAPEEKVEQVRSCMRELGLIVAEQ